MPPNSATHGSSRPELSPSADAPIEKASEKKRKVKSVAFGASPRIYPRPPYPEFRTVLLSFLKEVIWQGGGHGTILSLMLFPIYQISRVWARNMGLSEPMYFAIITSLSHSAMYLIFNSLFMMMDNYGWCREYKLERKEWMKPKPALMRKMFFEAFIGQVRVVAAPPKIHCMNEQTQANKQTNKQTNKHACIHCNVEAAVARVSTLRTKLIRASSLLPIKPSTTRS